MKRIFNLSSNTKIGIIIFALLIFTYIYFQQSFNSWNTISRVALILSLIEHSSFSIDNYHKATGDKAFYNGKYYSDKAPGASFTALPFIYITYRVLKLTENKRFTWKTWYKIPSEHKVYIIRVCSLVCSGLVTALTAISIFFISQKIGSSTSGAIFASISFGLATPAWGWATQYFGHAFTTFCLFTSFSLIIYLNNITKIHCPKLFGFLFGSLISWSVTVDYTSLIPAAIIGSYGLFLSYKWFNNKFPNQFVKYSILGGSLLILPLFLNNYLCFGSPLVTGYKYTIGFEEFPRGFYWMSLPNIQTLYNILFSKYRGIIWLAPILPMTFYGVYLYFKNKKYKYYSLVISIITLYYFLFNSSLYNWDGGSSTGPRYITPILPFLCLSLSFLWSQSNNQLRMLLLSLFILSFVINLICVSVNMTSPEYIKNPIFEYLIPNFIKGNIPKGYPLFQSFVGHKFLIPFSIVLIISLVLVLKINYNEIKNRIYN